MLDETDGDMLDETDDIAEEILVDNVETGLEEVLDETDGDVLDETGGDVEPGEEVLLETREKKEKL